jgi:hypothetical protein
LGPDVTLSDNGAGLVQSPWALAAPVPNTFIRKPRKCSASGSRGRSHTDWCHSTRCSALRMRHCPS